MLRACILSLVIATTQNINSLEVKTPLLSTLGKSVPSLISTPSAALKSLEPAAPQKDTASFTAIKIEPKRIDTPKKIELKVRKNDQPLNLDFTTETPKSDDDDSLPISISVVHTPSPYERHCTHDRKLKKGAAWGVRDKNEKLAVPRIAP